MVSIFPVMVALSGCQALARPTAVPTPTPIRLAPEATATQAPPATTAVATSAGDLPSPTPADAPAETPADASAVATQAISTADALPQERLMALGTRLTLALRAEPRANAAAVAQVPGAQAFWAEGRSADGRWLWVTYGDQGAHGWLAVADARLLGEATGLLVVQQVAAAPAAPAAPAAGKSTTAGRAPAPAARLPGKLAFQTAIGGDIYMVNADGTGLRRVTDGMDPILSPDGTQLAFTRWGSPNGVFVLDLRTGEERRIATVDRPRSPTWRADNGELAFTHVTKSTTCRATPFGCLSDDDLRERFGGHDCLDSPFGRFCISDFPLSQIDVIGVARVGADGQSWQDVVSETDAQSLTWRSRQDEFLFRSAGGLQTIGADGRPQQLVHNVDLNSPAVSPDGQRIAVQLHLHDHKDIFLLDAAGQVVQRLTTPPYGGGHAPDNVAPAWSPDGKTILFLSNRDGGTWRLYRMNADGSDQTPFLPGALKDIPFRYDFAAERVVSWGK